MNRQGPHWRSGFGCTNRRNTSSNSMPCSEIGFSRSFGLAGEACATRELVGRDHIYLLGNGLERELAQAMPIGARDHLADDVHLAGDGTDNRNLADHPTAPLGLRLQPAVPVLQLAADVGLVDL